MNALASVTIVLRGLAVAVSLHAFANTSSADISLQYDACGFRTISWTPVEGAALYKVERRECDDCLGAWKLVAEVSAVAVDDFDAPALEYRVRALDQSGSILETQSANGDRLLVQRLSIASAREFLPPVGCGGVVRLEVAANIPAMQDQAMFEWRCNGVPIGTTVLPSIELPVDASLSGAIFTVTATNSCEISIFEWQPFRLLEMPEGEAMRWTSLLHQLDAYEESGNCWDCQLCCGGAEPGTCDCSSCCSSSTSSSQDRNTPCNPIGLGQEGASMFASASDRRWSYHHGGTDYWSNSSHAESWVASAIAQWPMTLRVEYSLQPGDFCATRAAISQDDIVLWSIDQSDAGSGTAMVPVSEGTVTIMVEAGGCMGLGPYTDSATLGVQLSVLPPDLDCNTNRRPDAIDVLSGTSSDIDSDGTPDECQTVTVPSQYPTIQAAIDAAPTNAMRIVSVAPGEHAGPVDFLGKPIIVRGAGAAQTAVVGSGGQSLSVVRFTGGEPAIAALESVTIRGGTTGTPFPGAPQYLCGGGIFGKGSAASIRDCVIEQNSAGFGGGAYLFDHTGRIERCIVRGNAASEDGGGLQLYGGSVQLIDSLVEQNSAGNRGGGLHLVRGTPTVARTSIRQNACSGGAAGGISWVPTSAAAALLFLDDASITSNTALTHGGIGIIDDAGTTKTRIRGSTACLNLPSPQISGNYDDLGGNVVCMCAADIDGNGGVDGADLGRLLFDWGPCAGACASDLNADGVVNGADLGALLSAWGGC